MVWNILKNNLAKNIFHLFFLQGMNYILPLLSLPFLFRFLGASMYGVIATSYSFYTFCNIIIDFGYNLSSTRDISMNINDKEVVNKIVTITLFSKGIICLVCILGVLLVVFSVPNFRQYYIIFLLMLGIPIGNFLFPVWYFQGVEKMKYLTVIYISAKLFSYIPMFIFVRKANDIYIVAISYSFGYMLAGIISIYILCNKFSVRFVMVRLYDITVSLKKSSSFFLSRLSASLYSIGNTVFLGYACGNDVAGYYNIAEKMIQAFSGLISPFTQALYPYMIKQRNILLFKKILLIGSIGGIIITILMYCNSSFIIAVVFNTNSILSLNIFRILLCMTFFIIPSYLLGYPFLAALGHIKYTNITVIIAGGCYFFVVMVLFLLNKVSPYSIAVSYVLAELIVFIMRIYGTKKYKLL